MSQKTVCHRRFPSWTTLALGTAAAAALVLLLAGWGIAFWIVAPLALLLAVIAVVDRRRHGADGDYRCERTENQP